MNARDLLRAALAAQGADGLCTDGCGCDITDLMPCDACPAACVPARRLIATEPGDHHDIGDVIYVEIMPNAPDHRGA